MPTFAPALDSVLGHLDLARQHGRPLRASREVLAALAAARSEVGGQSSGASEIGASAVGTSEIGGRSFGALVIPRHSSAEPVASRGGAEEQVSRAAVDISPVTRPVERELAPASKSERLATLQARASACVKCPHLAASRKTVVFGVGDPDADLMFVGEAPGADEDRQGEPFVGKAGQLLTKIIQTMGLSRERVYIANILKCRPDTPGQAYGNRKPTPEEMATCLPYLEEQIAIIQPKVLVALGGTAVTGLLGGEVKITSARGNWHDFRGIPLMPTFHPSFLLRPENEAKKRQTWEDMLMVKERLGLEITARERRYFLPKAGAAGE